MSECLSMSESSLSLFSLCVLSLPHLVLIKENKEKEGKNSPVRGAQIFYSFFFFFSSMYVKVDLCFSPLFCVWIFVLMLRTEIKKGKKKNNNKLFLSVTQ